MPNPTPELEQVRLLLSITERGSGGDLIEFLNERQIHMHLQANGQGTASSEMMDILGLGSSDKDIVLSFATESAMQRLAHELNDNLSAVGRWRGIMMIVSPSALSRLFAVIVNRRTGAAPVTEGENPMKNEYQHSLICVAVNQGYTDQVMTAAKRAGATGGTVIRARLAGAEQASQFHGITLQEEKEIVTILAPDTVRDQIMEAVNKECGLRTEANGILCALPVDKAFKI